MMQRKSLAKKIKEAQELLGADNKQMARQMNLGLPWFEAIKNGEMVLPLVSQRALEKRLEGILQRCGLK